MDTRFYTMTSTTAAFEECLYSQHTPRSARHATWAPGTDFSQITCPLEHENHMRPGPRCTPLYVNLPYLHLPDILWTSYGEILVPERTIDLFQKHGLTGFALKPVTVVSVKGYRGSSFPRAWELVVIGNAGPEILKPGRSYGPPCPGCGLREKHNEINGIHVNPATWDGSDISCTTDYPRIRILSEKAKDVIMGHKLEYCVIYPAEQYPTFGGGYLERLRAKIYARDRNLSR